MNLGLESDLSNPNFAGAVANPDKLLHVEFYMFEPLDQHKSQTAGKRVYQTVHRVDENGKVIDTGEKKRVPFIRIMKPGDNTSILEVEAREDHKRRWPEEWLYFATQEGLIDTGSQIPGWKIEEWSHINSDNETIRNLKYLRFYTVEQIAGASDSQIQRLGMGGLGLREAAKMALREKVSKDINKDIQSRDEIIAKQGQAIEEMQKKLEALTNPPTVPVVVNELNVAPKKKGGRPKGSKNKPKVTETPTVQLDNT